MEREFYIAGNAIKTTGILLYTFRDNKYDKISLAR